VTENAEPEIREAIRDDSLRLTFTEQEADFIRRRIIACQRIVWLRMGLAAVTVAVLTGFVAMWMNGPPAVIPPETYERYAHWIPGLAVLALCAVVIAVFFVIAGRLDVAHYRAMQREHEEFLKGYKRELPE
jgi:hypothetical protein